jgi:hypothetical protein
MSPDFHHPQAGKVSLLPLAGLIRLVLDPLESIVLEYDQKLHLTWPMSIHRIETRD